MSDIKLLTSCDTCGLVYNAVEPGTACLVCRGTIRIDIQESFEQRSARQLSQQEFQELLDSLKEQTAPEGAGDKP